MTKPAIMFLLSSTVVMAGTVHFNPPSATITPGTQSVSFDVSVSWETLPTIDTVNVLIFSDSETALEFDYAQSLIDSTTVPLPEPAPFIWCEYDCGHSIGFAGNNFSPNGWASPLLVGTLTVDTSGLLPGALVELGIDPQIELNLVGSAISLVSNGVSQDPLSGVTTITVVPEPAIAGYLAFVMGATMIQRKQVFP